MILEIIVTIYFTHQYIGKMVVDSMDPDIYMVKVLLFFLVVRLWGLGGGGGVVVVGGDHQSQKRRD